MPDSAAMRPEVQYATLEQQGDTAQLGMWVFLVNETLFFGALIFTYFLYRLSYPQEFAEAAKDATSLSDYENRMEKWRQVRKQFVEGANKNSKPTPKDRRNLLVSALNDAIKLAKE